MNPLSVFVNAPAARLARLTTGSTPIRVGEPQRSTPVGWDNRPSWDNWSRR
ncbi:MAG TPA: hypothetical protein VK453_13350 [Micromonosporaceae bacterium]|nr:hypothetical protein [Micromonosporaceae bacterium]